MTRPRILVVFGTRPEAIKMAPVVHALRGHAGLDTRVIVTGQHRALLDQVLDAFGIAPDVDLNLMRDGQSLDALAAALLTGLGAVFDREAPARVLVHGDTLTTLAATLAAHFRRLPVGHVEAGLRSGDLHAPWPEEGNRRIAGALADLHFAPTDAAAAALRRENVAAAAIHVTGNTVADALRLMRARIAAGTARATTAEALLARCAGRRIVTVTAHRRENLGERLAAIAAAITRIADRDDVRVVVPLHPNPHVADVLARTIGAHPHVAAVPALGYADFVRLMAASTLVLTDSGGVQEEAPALGVPVLVMRDVTERHEGVASGGARLVGTDSDAIVAQVAALLDDGTARARMAVVRHPYGDGHAATRIAAIVARAHGV